MELYIPIASVFVSGVVALLVARLQVRAAVHKLDFEYKRKATELLFQKRMEVYPTLHSAFVQITKKRWTDGLDKNDLTNLIQVFDEWEIENALFISPLGMEKMRRARIVFQDLDDKIEQSEKLSKNKTGKLVAELYSLEMLLKTELGVLEAEGFHNPDQTKRFRDIINFDGSPKRKKSDG